jgi:hypothetical protein
MFGGLKALAQDFMRRDAEHNRHQPDAPQGTEAYPRQPWEHQVLGHKAKSEGQTHLSHHQGTHQPPHFRDMLGLIRGATFHSYTCHQWVVDHLHHPDQPNHGPGDCKMNAQEQPYRAGKSKSHVVSAHESKKRPELRKRPNPNRVKDIFRPFSLSTQQQSRAVRHTNGTQNLNHFGESGRVTRKG